MGKAERRPTKYIQLNDGGARDPLPGEFPPVTKRVGQNPDPYKGDFADYGTKRTTAQWKDHCNLKCPGCYAKPYLSHGRSLGIINNLRRTTPLADFSDQIDAHGPSLEKVYFLGLEPTLNPGETAAMMRNAHDKGLTSSAITNGAVPVEVFDATFGEALESGKLYRVVVSLDSIDEGIHNRVRGRDFAYRRTMDTIRHAVKEGINLQVTSTVWADNYHTILDTVDELHSMGVRGFKFHEGSLEGAPDYKETTARRVSPLAWRALTTQLEGRRNRFAEQGDLDTFLFPYLYYTEQELRDGIIGDERLTDQYLKHVDRQERGQASELPFIACPAVDVPQVYMLGNDGQDSQGAISICPIHTTQSGSYLAEFDGQKRRFLTVLEPKLNQMQQIMDSPNLCPARPSVTRDGNPSDRSRTEAGDVYHACRYISRSQFPFADKQFGAENFGVISDFYQMRWDLLSSGTANLRQTDMVEQKFSTYAGRLGALKRLQARSQR